MRICAIREEQANRVWLRPVLAVLFFAWLIGHAAAQTGLPDQIYYNGVELRPGDILDFHAELKHGEIFKHAGEGSGYGHVSMYLGRDPKSGSPTFLDFTTARKSDKAEQFYGRILAEAEFLRKQRRDRLFDIYRARPEKLGPLDKARLWREAKESALKKSFASEEFCSEAAILALEKATGGSFGGCEKSLSTRVKIHGRRVRISPNGIAHGGCFEKTNTVPYTVAPLVAVAGNRERLDAESARVTRELAEASRKVDDLIATLKSREEELQRAEAERRRLEREEDEQLAPLLRAVTEATSRWNTACAGKTLPETEYRQCVSQREAVKTQKEQYDREKEAADARVTRAMAPLEAALEKLRAEVPRLVADLKGARAEKKRLEGRKVELEERHRRF